MLTINIDPTIIHLGPLALSWYGLAVAAAIAVGAWATGREAARRGVARGVFAGEEVARETVDQLGHGNHRR